MRLARIGLFVIAPLVCGSVASAQAPQGPKDDAEKPGSISDQNAKQEPTAKFTPDSEPSYVFVDGTLNVPGAPTQTQTQTTPSKFSDHNDGRDQIPIMARGPQLDDAQKKLVLAAIKGGHGPVDGVKASPAMELPGNVAMHEWPLTLIDQVPAMRDTKYVQLTDKVLIVRPANRIVIGEIAN